MRTGSLRLSIRTRDECYRFFAVAHVKDVQRKTFQLDCFAHQNGIRQIVLSHQKIEPLRAGREGLAAGR